jgi:hypothetical protein
LLKNIFNFPASLLTSDSKWVVAMAVTCDRGSAVWGLDSGTAATAPLADKRQGGPNVSFVQNF